MLVKRVPIKNMNNLLINTKEELKKYKVET